MPDRSHSRGSTASLRWTKPTYERSRTTRSWTTPTQTAISTPCSRTVRRADPPSITMALLNTSTNSHNPSSVMSLQTTIPTKASHRLSWYHQEVFRSSGHSSRMSPAPSISSNSTRKGSIRNIWRRITTLQRIKTQHSVTRVQTSSRLAKMKNSSSHPQRRPTRSIMPTWCGSTQMKPRNTAH